MGAFDRANTLAIMASGYNPGWSDQTNRSSSAVFDEEGFRPSSDSDGVALNGALVTMLDVKLQRKAEGRSVDITVATDGGGGLEDGTTYTVHISIDANAGTYVDLDFTADSGSTVADYVSGMQAALALTALDGVVEINTYTVDGAAVGITIRGLNEDYNPTGQFGVYADDDGSGNLQTVVGEAISVNATLWCQYAGTGAPTGWRRVPGFVDLDIDLGGYAYPLNTAGLSRLFLQINTVRVNLWDASDGLGIEGVSSDRVTVSFGPTVVL